MSSDKSSPPVSIEPSNPYFIHPSDHLGQVLVTSPFNIGDNFDSWRRTILIALSAKNKLGFVDGSLLKPETNLPLVPFWQRCNDMVTSWLLNSLHPDVAQSVLYSNSAKEMWEELLQRFGQSNKAGVFQVSKDLTCVSQEDFDISAYFNRAKKLWDELSSINGVPKCTCGKCSCEINVKLDSYAQEHKLLQFLMGLNESYVHIRGNILMMSPFPNLGQVYSILVQEEQQRHMRASPSSGGASLVVERRFSPNEQNRAAYQTKQEGKRPQLFCDHCKRTGHTIDRCYKIHGFPSNTKSSNAKPRFGRSANNVWSEKDQKNKGNAHLSLPGLNQEQSQKLLHFLSTLQAKDDDSGSPREMSNAHMAGALL